MAMAIEVQRLQMGDVIQVELPDQGGEVEAMVIRDIDRADGSVRIVLRVEGRDEFVKEWPLGEMVTVIRGP